MKEAVVRCGVNLEDVTTLLDYDGDWNRSFIQTVKTRCHGTSCYWTGDGMTLRG